MLRRLARTSSRLAWVVVLFWLVAVAGANIAGQKWGGEFANDLSITDSDSHAAQELLNSRFPQLAGDGLQVVLHDGAGVTDRQVRSSVEAGVAAVTKVDGVASVTSPYHAGGMLSKDQTTAVVTVRFADQARDLDAATVDAAKDAFNGVRDLGVQVEYGGSALNIEQGPSGSEVIGLAAAVVVLLIAFGSLLAMVVPLITALLALGLGMGFIHLLAGHVDVGTAGPVVAAMIGLGVGIDYALLVVTRHREGLFAGHPVAESVETALATAGRSVLVAGATVIVAILSLFFFGIPFVATLGLASAITVATTLLAAVTLLPALLTLFGTNLDRFTIRPLRMDHGRGRTTVWHRWTRSVQLRPWRALIGALAILLLMAAPLLDLRLGTADASTADPQSTQRRAYSLVENSFGPGWTGPLLVTAEYPRGTKTATAARDLRTQLLAVDGVDGVGNPTISTDGRAAVLTVIPKEAPGSEQTEALVHRLRDETLPSYRGGTTHVGGPTATNVDLADTIGERLPWFMGLIVALSALLLLVEFRSIFVPIKAAIMNLLSVAAAYGAVVAVFQWGWLSDVIGAEPGPIESFAPMMLFAVLFGLSMDYEVFLLSRVREEYDETGDAGGAMADGVAATARVITAAASVMVVVFASFLLNDERVVNLFGFGLAVAIAVDATLVRLVLVPAVMAIAGRRAWYLPGWLRRILPRTHLEAHPVDPFEAELDRLDTDEHPALATRTRLMPGLTAPAPAGTTMPTVDAPLRQPPTRAGDALDVHRALGVLSQALVEHDREAHQYALLRDEHARLQARYDELVAALRTVTAVGGIDATGSTGATDPGDGGEEAHLTAGEPLARR